MKGYMLVIPADLTKDTVKTELSEPPKYTELQKAVGGYIEAVPYFSEYVGVKERHPAFMFCNEEGKMNRLEPNMRANAIWATCQAAQGIQIADQLVGDCVMLWGDPEFMESI